MLEVKELSFTYPEGKEVIKDLSFSMENHERVGLVAPSGYGKTTLGKILARQLIPTTGEVIYSGGKSLTKGPYPIQLIPQHPELAFNPRWKMKKIEEELGKAIPEEMMAGLRIKKEWFDRFPFELSGGELQRFSIARTLSSEPDFLIADEISTMLDVITQAEIWRFILEYIKEKEMGLLVMSHNPELLKVLTTRELSLPDLNQLNIEDI